MLQALRVLLIGSAATVVVYAMLWLVAGVWDTPAPAAAFDTPRGEFDLYATPVREFGYRLPAFCAAAPGRHNLIFIGGSVARAYRPDIIGPAFPGWTVSDVSLDYANITEVRQAFAMMRDCFPPDGFRNTTFVLAVNILQFTSNRHAWRTPYTALQLDLLRHGLFSGQPGNVQPVMPWPLLRTTIAVLRPVLAAYAATYWGGIGIVEAYHKWAGVWHQPGADRPKEIQSVNSHFDSSDLRALQEQIEELDRFVAEVRGAGAGLIILDMPMGRWLAAALPQFDAYRAWFASYAKQNGIPYIDHVTLGSDADYVDGFHANPAGERIWSIAAVKSLRDVPPISP